MLTRGGDGNCGLEDWEIRAEPNGINKISKSCGDDAGLATLFLMPESIKKFVWPPSQGSGETRTERGHRSRFLVVPNEDLPVAKIFDDDAGVFSIVG